MAYKKENKNRNIGWTISLVLHGVLLLIFFFLFAWRAPDPPHPEYGIELNFGLDARGGGDIQPLENTPITDQAEEDPLPGETSAETTDSREATEEVQEADVQQNTESDVTVEKKKASDKVVKEEVKKEATKTSEKETKPVAKTGASGETGKSLYPTNASHGDNAGEKGDKGNPEGKIDANALYGTPGGGGGGPTIEMSGWKPDFLPKPKDDISNENGRIVFQIKIDDQGEIVSVITLEKTVSPTVEKIYKEEVQRLTFSKTAGNSQSAAISTGKITFIIRAK